jgi:hypothetical protein
MLTHIKDARNAWTVIVNNKPYQFDPSHKRYDDLVHCVNNGDGETFVNLLELGRAITKWSVGNFKVEAGVLKYGDEEINDVLAERILEMIEQKFDFEPMLKFVENLYQNFSMRAVEELYKFLEHKHLPITSDGCFIAYKGLAVYMGDDRKDKLGRDLRAGDYVDLHTRKSFRNNVGDVNTMNRRNVNDDANVGCAEGLHVGSMEYATGYASGGPVVLCKINPMDVVSVPHDCDCQKVRVSKYEVVGIFSEPLDKPVETMYDDLDDDEEDQWNGEDYEDEDEDDTEDRYIGEGW